MLPWLMVQAGLLTGKELLKMEYLEVVTENKHYVRQEAKQPK